MFRCQARITTHRSLLLYIQARHLGWVLLRPQRSESNAQTQAPRLPLKDKPWSQKRQRDSLRNLSTHFREAWERHWLSIHPNLGWLTFFTFQFLLQCAQILTFFHALLLLLFCWVECPVGAWALARRRRWRYQISLVLDPRARSPSVEKKSSISFSRSRLRFSASSRARSELRSLISSMRCFFFSCSISCSRRSIWAQRAALDSSSLEEGRKEWNGSFCVFFLISIYGLFWVLEDSKH